MEKDRREQLVLTALLERRLTLEEETRGLKARTTELTHREHELRDETAALDAILGAKPETPPPMPTPAPPSPAMAQPAAVLAPGVASTEPTRKRRRKGSRMGEILPMMRTVLGSSVFTTEQVVEIVEKEEAMEHRKAYFAAWSLVRDLVEDGVVELVSEEGAGPRRKRTYRITEALGHANGR